MHRLGEAALRGDRDADGELGRRGLVHARRVGEPHAFWQCVRNAVEADRLPLHELHVHALKACERAHPVPVRRHDKINVVSRGFAAHVPEQAFNALGVF